MDLIDCIHHLEPGVTGMWYIEPQAVRDWLDKHQHEHPALLTSNRARRKLWITGRVDAERFRADVPFAFPAWDELKRCLYVISLHRHLELEDKSKAVATA